MPKEINNIIKISVLIILFWSTCVFANVDLHMHLTMEIPLSPFYEGQLNKTAAANSPLSRLKSRIDAKSLHKSGLDLIVAVIYVNPIWGDPSEQVADQILLLDEFCLKNPNWKIATEPNQAREFLKLGHRVFVLSLEGGEIYKNEKLFEDIIFKYGIRIVTPMHFSDIYNTIGRPAKQKGLFGPVQKIINFFQKKSDHPFTKLGEKLITFLFKNKIWIDLSHSSEAVQIEIIHQMPTGYPILFTHTVLKKYYGSDRGVDEKMLIQIKKTDGAVGLLPSDEMLINTPIDETDCKKSNAFLTQWYEIENTIGVSNLFLGSDLNSPIPTLSPKPSDIKCKPFMKNGLISVADLSEIVNIKNTNPISDAEQILKMWERVRR